MSLALDYLFYMDTAKPVSELMRNLVLGGLDEYDGRVLEKSGMTVAGTAVHHFTRDLIRDELGFAPTVSIVCTIDKEMATEAIDMMIADVIKLLDLGPGDTLLVMSGDRPILARKGGQIILNKDFYDFWTDDRRAGFPRPHVVATLPML
jgi:hypothetical protein